MVTREGPRDLLVLSQRDTGDRGSGHISHKETPHSKLLLEVLSTVFRKSSRHNQ